MMKEMDFGNMALFPVSNLGDLKGGHTEYGLAAIMEIVTVRFQDGTCLRGRINSDKDRDPQLLRIGHLVSMDQSSQPFLLANLQARVPQISIKQRIS